MGAEVREMQIICGDYMIDCDRAVQGKGYIKWYCDGQHVGTMSGIANMENIQLVGGEWETEIDPVAQRLADLEAALAELAYGGGM